MYRIGVDLGGTNIVVGVIDSNKQIVSQVGVKTPVGGSYIDIVKSIYSSVLSAMDKINVDMTQIDRIGVASPGTVNQDSGIVEFAGNLKFHNVPLKRELENLFKTTVTVCNDGDAMAYGEFIEGSGKGKNSFIAVVLGTGVGGAVIIDNRIIRGTNYAVGEIGHMVIGIDGEQCNCGRKGCFEAYASATALIRQTKRSMQYNPDTVMWQLVDGDLENVTAKTVFDAAKLEDITAKKVIDNYVKYLACGVTNLINIFQPEALCIAGGVSNEGEYLLTPLRKIVERERYSRYSAEQTRIHTSVLGGNAAIIGAAYI